ncbi:MAG TPA: zf-HC2 domain-containing protein [Candidatus Acidoferrales bacterium]|nr:zf-HC2 domain-containing protein [Candidatus Acidoferrales bacterium]
MKCSLLTLSCALDGELSRERQMELDAHLITCERCKTGMRYLREETERISLLAPVRLTADKATALLERSRVLVSAPGHSMLTSVESSPEDDHEPVLAAPDPFGALGIGAAILEVSEPAEVTPPHEVEEEPPTEPAAEEPKDLGPELEHGSAFEAEEADRTTSDALAAVPEELWLADTPDEPATESMADTPALNDEVVAPLFPAAGEIVASAPRPPIEPPGNVAAEDAPVTPSAAQEDAVVSEALPDFAEPPPTSNDEEPAEVIRPSSMVVPGWEPATELKMPWGDIPAATPTKDTWAPELAGLVGLPVPRQTPLPPAAPFPAARPAPAAVPGLPSDRKATTVGRKPPRRGAGGGFRRPVPPKSGKDGPAARSWTRTGLIAVAALAAVLIVWNITHGSKPAGAPHAQSQATPAISAKPSPSATATPSPTAAPVVLTGTQTVGSSGSGYQVQSVQYGVHGSQFWVVFHFSGGSGVPQITSGFDGSQTIYLEMQGVAPGTAVAQPAAGSLVTSVSVGHVAGFTGAVYILQLSRAAQISPSELTGSESGAPGYLAIVQ